MPTTATRTTKKTSPSRHAAAPRHRTRSTRRPITPEDLRNFQLLGDPQISPDGTTIIFTHKKVGEKNDYQTNLWIVAADGRESSIPRPFTAGNRDASPRWSPDGSQVAFISSREKHNPQLALIPAPASGGGEARTLTDFPEGSISEFRWSPDGTMIAVRFREQAPERTQDATKQREETGGSTPPYVIDDWWYRLDGDGYFGAQRHHLYIVDVATGKHRKLYDKDTLGHFSFDFSPDSREIVIATNRDRKAMIRPWKDELLRLNLKSGKTRAIPNLPEGPKTHVRWSPDGRHIAWAGRAGRDGIYGVDNLELWTCAPDGGAVKCLTGKEDYCLMAIALADTAEAVFGPKFQWSPDGKRLYMQIGWHGEMHIASVPARGGAISFHTRGRHVHQMGNLAADGRTMSLMRGSATTFEEVFVARTSDKSFKPRQLTNLNGPLLKSLELSTPHEHWITSADGTKVHVWSIRPIGYKTGKRYPTVLEIHGGPHGQYGVGLFHEFQVLAAAGYAVYYSNPRGSKGYGRDFTAAIKGHWGGKDWEDIQAVTAFMKTQPEVNPKKMGVMGGSYGGYMTNWVIGHTNEFAGAITDRCVSNLVSMFGTSDYTDEPDRYWPGNAWDRPEQLWEQSPLKYLGQAKTPTLIIHSEGDLRCNVEQGEQVFTVLKLRNVPTRFVRYPRETSHGLSRNGPPDLRLHRLHQILDWWKRWLK